MRIDEDGGREAGRQWRNALSQITSLIDPAQPVPDLQDMEELGGV